jgi:hypothetical protein
MKRSAIRALSISRQIFPLIATAPLHGNPTSPVLHWVVMNVIDVSGKIVLVRDHIRETPLQKSYSRRVLRQVERPRAPVPAEAYLDCPPTPRIAGVIGMQRAHTGPGDAGATIVDDAIPYPNLGFA